MLSEEPLARSMSTQFLTNLSHYSVKEVRKWINAVVIYVEEIEF